MVIVAVDTNEASPVDLGVEDFGRLEIRRNEDGRFETKTSGLSGNYDRHVYMEDSGQLTFGVWTGFTNTITSWMRLIA